MGKCSPDWCRKCDFLAVFVYTWRTPWYDLGQQSVPHKLTRLCWSVADPNWLGIFWRWSYAFWWTTSCGCCEQRFLHNRWHCKRQKYDQSCLDCFEIDLRDRHRRCFEWYLAMLKISAWIYSRGNLHDDLHDESTHHTSSYHEWAFPRLNWWEI